MVGTGALPGEMTPPPKIGVSRGRSPRLSGCARARDALRSSAEQRALLHAHAQSSHVRIPANLIAIDTGDLAAVRCRGRSNKSYHCIRRRRTAPFPPAAPALSVLPQPRLQPSLAEPSRAEPCRAEPSRAEPCPPAARQDPVIKQRQQLSQINQARVRLQTTSLGNWESIIWSVGMISKPREGRTDRRTPQGHTARKHGKAQRHKPTAEARAPSPAAGGRLCRSALAPAAELPRSRSCPPQPSPGR
eukprot:XP_025010082.1 uncharacterized protein LOC112533278 [Gallus gallus]